MLKAITALLSIASLGLGSAAIAAPLPGMTGVSSNTTIQNFEGTSFTEGEVWGDFSEIGLSVNTGASGTGGLTLDLSDLSGSLSLSAGAVAGVNLFDLEGGFFEESRSRVNISGQSVTSGTNFN
jgi:hypothetical protein